MRTGWAAGQLGDTKLKAIQGSPVLTSQQVEDTICSTTVRDLRKNMLKGAVFLGEGGDFVPTEVSAEKPV
jgi:hypothetical protein